MTIKFNNVKLTKAEIEKINLWRIIFGGVKVECTNKSITLTVDGRDHLWRKKNLNNNFLFTLLQSRSETVTFRK